MNKYHSIAELIKKKERNLLIINTKYIIYIKKITSTKKQNIFNQLRKLILLVMIWFFLFGAMGALCKDIIQDNNLVLPHFHDGKFYLGFLGGMAIGAVSGYLTNNSPIMAFTSGFTGSSIITLLAQKKTAEAAESNLTAEQIIRKVATEESVDPELAVRVARCESSLNPFAVNKNSNGTIDRGLFQINDYWHPEVTPEQAFDPIQATKFFCKQFKAGFLSDWKATKSCWDK